VARSTRASRQYTTDSTKEEGNEVEVHTGITGADAHDDLANVDASNGAVGLAPGSAHAGLQTIGTGAGQHLVDADDVIRVGADAEVEAFLSGDLDEIPVQNSVSMCSQTTLAI
jgi:hypothetical protein